MSTSTSGSAVSTLMALRTSVGGPVRCGGATTALRSKGGTGDVLAATDEVSVILSVGWQKQERSVDMSICWHEFGTTATTRGLHGTGVGAGGGG